MEPLHLFLVRKKGGKIKFVPFLFLTVYRGKVVLAKEVQLVLGLCSICTVVLKRHHLKNVLHTVGETSSVF